MTEAIPVARAKGYNWISKTRQRVVVDELAVKLNIKSLEDWYNITSTMLLKESNQEGKLIIRKHKGSPSRLLQSVYPEYLISCNISTC